MSVVKISSPTDSQLVNDVERVFAVFVVAFFGSWALTGYALSTNAVHGAVLAGITAAYGIVKSTLTTL